MSKGLHRSRIILAVTGVFVAVLAVHSAVYLTATARIEANLPAFVAAAAAEGWRLETGPPVRGGWPWAPTVRVPRVVVTKPALGLRWTTEAVDLSTPFYDLLALHIMPVGEQAIQLGSSFASPLRAAEAWVRVPFSADAPAMVSVRNLVVRAPALEMRAADVHGRVLIRSGAPAFDLVADGIQVVPSLPAPFAGPMSASAQFVVRETTCASASSSAFFELGVLDLVWGPLRVTGTGSGRLDETCQPSGRATLHVKGGAELVDAGARAGLIASGPASAARAVLGLLAIAARGEPITLPVVLANRTLSVAQFPLLRLPMID